MLSLIFKREEPMGV